MIAEWTMTKSVRDELNEAQRRLDQATVAVRQVILILTAEQAIKAQRVVREAGRRGR